MVRSLGLVCLALSCLAWGGCAQLPQPQADALAPGAVLARGEASPLEPAQLRQRLEPVQVLLVGEVHDQASHHLAQLEMLKAFERPGEHLVVGVEWLDWQAQPACDLFSSGQVSLEEFARLAQWETRWGFPLEIYAPILEHVRQRGHRLAALNAPVEVVRQVARQGLESLDQAQRAQLAPALDLDDPSYRAQLDKVAGLHGMSDPKALERFFAAQAARDDTMAWRLALALHPWPDSGQRAVLFAGGGHVSHGQGLAPRLRRQLPGALLATALPSATWQVPPPDAPPLAWPADYLPVTAMAPPTPRLGLVLRPQDQGLLVERVLPDSPAQTGGFQAGDLLVAVDGQPTREVKAIHQALKNAPRSAHRYSLRRGERSLELDIALEPAP